MSYNSTKFYNCIENDVNLRRPEKALFKLLAGFWIANGCKHLNVLHDGGLEVFEARKLKIRVQCGHKVLAKKLCYTRADNIQPLIKGLVKVGYIKHFPGTGTKGQDKNCSKFSIFHLNIPTNYDLPTKRVMLHDKAVEIAKRVLSIEYGALAVHTMIAQVETNKAITAAKAKPTLENYRKITQAKRRLQANEIKAS